MDSEKMKWILTLSEIKARLSGIQNVLQYGNLNTTFEKEDLIRSIIMLKDDINELIKQIATED